MIKVIEGLKPWEVMKAAEEEKRIAIRKNYCYEWEPAKDPGWNWLDWQYAVIDESQPELDWEKFDWDFFGQHGGLSVRMNDVIRDISDYFTNSAFTGADADRHSLRESHFYYWHGGECPVPENVEVTVKYIATGWDKDHIVAYVEEITSEAVDIEWQSLSNKDGAIIAFKLTGRIL